MTVYCVVDMPKVAVSLSDSLWVCGWAFGTTDVREVAVGIDGGPLTPATHGQSRPDVEALNPGACGSGKSGFRFGPVRLDSDRDLSPPVELVVRVTLESGEQAKF
jgi:hypothetical protein